MSWENLYFPGESLPIAWVLGSELRVLARHFESASVRDVLDFILKEARVL
jgi:hypothetical protein